ncbi:LONG-CHAIN-ALCOHOL OXIDASE [Salix viminalis]|uniref:LONG-CHAIN-ALCOHOL OXIDASE n=1 Tax=Salix viminalis TaxID=40686 RepID=A0A9Q0QCP9_SALVM|nr:LONG-CHAIN-ALCOHOL OXIDASE [Salix viminalis]
MGSLQLRWNRFLASAKPYCLLCHQFLSSTGSKTSPPWLCRPSTQPLGSQTPMPDEMAELLTKRGLPEAVFLVRLVLWLLSTRLGTFFLCGSLCFGEKWPYLKIFSSISLDKREKVLQKWFKHRVLTPIRTAFVYVKILILFVFFSRVDEKGDNPAWEAIEYHVGTDEDPGQVPKERPLRKGLIDTNQETDSTLLHSLKERGLEVTQDPRKNLYKIKCDVVIVGSGCGGGVAAAVLATSGQKVFVIEKGKLLYCYGLFCLGRPFHGSTI